MTKGITWNGNVDNLWASRRDNGRRLNLDGIGTPKLDEVIILFSTASDFHEWKFLFLIIISSRRHKRNIRVKTTGSTRIQAGIKCKKELTLYSTWWKKSVKCSVHNDVSPTEEWVDGIDGLTSTLYPSGGSPVQTIWRNKSNTKPF